MARALVAVLIVLAAGGAASAGIADHPLAGAPPLSQGQQATGAVQISSAVALEQQVVAAVNEERAHRGLSRLRISRSLIVAARSHSVSMAEQGYFDHTSPSGVTFARRIRAAYPVINGRAWGAGENLAWASPDLSGHYAVGMWLGSSEHRQNLLAPRWREIGVGVVRAHAAPGVFEGLDVIIVTADFGLR